MTPEQQQAYLGSMWGGGIPQREDLQEGGTYGSKWDKFQNLYRTNKAERDEKEAAQYSLAAGDGAYFNPSGIPGINPMRNSSPGGGIFGATSFDRRMLDQQNGYGDLFGGIANFGSKALDKFGEWSGKQGITDWAKIGLGIKDQFFDRPKLINSYLDRTSVLNDLARVKTGAIKKNIAGVERAEARKTAMDLANYNAQRPQGTPEKTQLTPSTYV